MSLLTRTPGPVDVLSILWRLSVAVFGGSEGDGLWAASGLMLGGHRFLLRRGTLSDVLLEFGNFAE